MSEGKRDRTSALEWVIGALGALLVSAIFVVLISNAIGPSNPPAISAEIESVEPAGANFVVEVIVRNDGDTTAAQVALQASHQHPDGSSEQKQVTLDYLPPHSTRRAGFIFSHDPRSGQVTIEAQGYADP